MGLFRRFRRGETLPSTAYQEVVTNWGPDVLARDRAESMANATNTASPMARGVKRSGAMGFTGDRGYGVNRWAGGMWVNNIPVSPQGYYSVVSPQADPLSLRLGYGSGVAGQPGLPSTGSNDSADASAWLMSLNQLTPGMGG
jgi:hypothetical protein